MTLADPDPEKRNLTHPTHRGASAPKEMETERDIVKSEDPYSIFSGTEKWIIVSLIALAGLFSPLTSNIYFPAIPTLSREFRKPIELINLTVTVYIVMQGVAPMIFGPLADRYGRRPCYAGCLTVLTISNIGLALVPTSAFWLLLLLRCIQAMGSASTIAIGAGVIGDISTREERGGFFGFFTLGPMIGPVIGPVIGGAISDSLGWRALFWFLTISTAVCLLIMILLFPETLRSLVGNGSNAPPRFYRPLLPLIPKEGPTTRTVVSSTRKTSQNPFRLFTHVDILILLALNAIINGVMYGVIATLSTTFEATYTFLTNTTIGLCFLAYGGGMIIGGVLNGRLLNREYQIYKGKLGGSVMGDSMNTTNSQDLFPIEKARLRLLPFEMLTFAGCVGGYGWALQHQVNIGVPLVLQFIIGYMSIAGLNSTSTLMIDFFPTQGSSITACNNLVRCTFAAVVVSVIQLIINKIGLGWTYTILCCLSLLAIPLIVAEIANGPRCREARCRRDTTHEGPQGREASANKEVVDPSTGTEGTGKVQAA